MSLITMQSFDSHDWSAMQFRGWTANGTPVHLELGGRRGGGAVSIQGTSDYVSYELPDPEGTIILGVAVYFSAASIGTARSFISLYDSASAQLHLRINANLSLSVLRSGVLLANSAAGVISPQHFHYIELRALISNTGRFEVRVDEQRVVSMVSADTQATANSQVTHIRLGYIDGDTDRYDDLYLLNTDGTRLNDFLGDVMVECTHPDGNGTTNNFTPLAGDNYENVDELLMDEDTSYVTSNTVGHIDLYTMDSLPDVNGAAVLAVMSASAVRHDAGTPSVKPLIRTGGTTFEGDEIFTTGDYVYADHIWELNPDTGDPWTEAEVNAAEAGIKYES